MNLLIALMSETAVCLSRRMKNRELTLKLSSVSLISRRLRAFINIGSFLSCGPYLEQLSSNFSGGESGRAMGILDGRLHFTDRNIRLISQHSALSTTSINSDRSFEEWTDIKYYFNEMRYWAVLEHEALIDEQDDVIPPLDEVSVVAKMKQYADSMMRLYEESLNTPLPNEKFENIRGRGELLN